MRLTRTARTGRLTRSQRIASAGGGGGSVEYISSAQSTTGATITIPADVETGDLLLLTTTSWGAGGVIDTSDGNAGQRLTWTQIGTTQTNGELICTAWWAIADADAASDTMAVSRVAFDNDTLNHLSVWRGASTIGGVTEGVGPGGANLVFTFADYSSAPPEGSAEFAMFGTFNDYASFDASALDVVLVNEAETIGDDSSRIRGYNTAYKPGPFNITQAVPATTVQLWKRIAISP